MVKLFFNLSKPVVYGCVCQTLFVAYMDIFEVDAKDL